MQSSFFIYSLDIKRQSKSSWIETRVVDGAMAFSIQFDTSDFTRKKEERLKTVGHNWEHTCIDLWEDKSQHSYYEQ